MAEGRRDRIRAKVEGAGVRSLARHEVLEMFLYTFVARQDTLPAGRALLKRFGSLYGVFNAPRQELEQIEGVTPLAALYIAGFVAAAKRCLRDDGIPSVMLTNASHTERFLRAVLPAEKTLIALLTDAEYHPSLICSYAPDAPLHEIRADILRDAVLNRAYGVILARLNPQGVLPVDEDERKTLTELRRQLKPFAMTLLSYVKTDGGDLYFEE